jgi:hypothetical protein
MEASAATRRLLRKLGCPTTACSKTHSIRAENKSSDQGFGEIGKTNIPLRSEIMQWQDTFI